ncbi:MAG: hypothetical protein VB065_08310, partial [Eubacteriales bacterium]|nr:hypothetical protein [Eubacteriales bacterium]
ACPQAIDIPEVMRKLTPCFWREKAGRLGVIQKLTHRSLGIGLTFFVRLCIVIFDSIKRREPG